MELTGVISHPLMEVVLQLEYVVSWSGVAIMPVGTPTRSARRGSTVKVGSRERGGREEGEREREEGERREGRGREGEGRGREREKEREGGGVRGQKGVVGCRQLVKCSIITKTYHCIFSSLFLSPLPSSRLALLHPFHHPHSWLGSMAAVHVRCSPGGRMPHLY